MDVGLGGYENYLNNVKYTILIETLVMEWVEWEYSSGKFKGFETKYLTKVFCILHSCTLHTIALWTKNELYYYML